MDLMRVGTWELIRPEHPALSVEIRLRISRGLGIVHLNTETPEKDESKSAKFDSDPAI